MESAVMAQPDAYETGLSEMLPEVAIMIEQLCFKEGELITMCIYLNKYVTLLCDYNLKYQEIDKCRNY